MADLRRLALETGRPVDGRTDGQLLEGMRLLRSAIAELTAARSPALR